jgi:hypothetical protein
VGVGDGSGVGEGATVGVGEGSRVASGVGDAAAICDGEADGDAAPGAACEHAARLAARRMAKIERVNNGVLPRRYPFVTRVRWGFGP